MRQGAIIHEINQANLTPHPPPPGAPHGPHPAAGDAHSVLGWCSIRGVGNRSSVVVEPAMIETAIETALISLLMATLCVAWAWLVAPLTRDEDR
jgi:hypothetical protein